MNKRRNSLLAIVLIAFLLIVAGCASQRSPITPTATEQKAQLELHNLKLNNFAVQEDITTNSKKFNSEDLLWIIVETEGESIAEKYIASNFSGNLSDYMMSIEGSEYNNLLLQKQQKVKNAMSNSGVVTEFKYSYTTIINGFAALVKYGDLNTINELPYVNRVIISEEYNAPDAIVEEQFSEYFDVQTGILRNSHNLNGEGMVIAVIDSGLDYEHSAFQTMPENPALKTEDIEKVLPYLYGKEFISFTADEVYASEKVPFTFDYAMMDVNPIPTWFGCNYQVGYHGTHVAGIVAGDDDLVTGVVPKAQIIGMKVFPDTSSGSKTTDILAAISDCAILGVDIINMSLGSPNGFAQASWAGSDFLNEIYMKIQKLGIAICASAGNSFNASLINQTGGSDLSNPEYGVIGSPSTYEPSLSVASCEAIPNYYFNVNNEFNITYYNGTNFGLKFRIFMTELLGENNSVSYEIVPVPGIGQDEDYANIDVNGKIALIKRGNLSFDEKERIAEKHGAAAVIIYNTSLNGFSPYIGECKIPVCGINGPDGEKIIAEYTSKGKAVLTINSDMADYTISEFSSWGPVNNLILKPDITAPGGNIFSSTPNNYSSKYSYMSGTSMASPNMAGAIAAIKEYVKNTYPSLTNIEMRTLCYRLAMSTATQIYDNNGNMVSPRHQGAGIVNIDEAVETKAYLSVTGSDRTKLSLGDDKNRDGIYTLSFNIVNMSEEALSYNINLFTLTEAIRDDGRTIAGKAYMLNAENTISVKNAIIDGSKITVNGNTTANIKIVITLSQNDKDYLNQFVNGTYVEGYCVFDSDNEDEIDLSIPYLAFYGDYTDANVFDRTLYDTEPYFITPMGIYGVYGEGALALGAYAGFALQTGVERPASEYDKIAISLEDNAINTIYTIRTASMRDIYFLEYEIRDAITKTSYWKGTASDVGKTHFNNGSIYATAYEMNIDMRNFSVSNNQQLEIVVTATLPYEGRNKIQQKVFPIVVDSEKPILNSSTIRKENDRTYVDLEVYDNHILQSIIIATKDIDEGATQAYEYAIPVYNWNKGINNKLTIDVTDYTKYLNDGELAFGFCDYAMNISAYFIGNVNEKAEINNIDVNTTDNKELLNIYNSVYSINAQIDETINYDTKNITVTSNGENNEHKFTVNSDGVLIKYEGPGGDIVIPDNLGIVKIGGSEDVFRTRKDITSVVVPEGVKELDRLAFFMCLNLENITLPKTLEVIGSDCFNACIKIKSFNLMDTRAYIFDNYVFANCFALEELYFPAVDGQTTILKYNTVTECPKLKRIECFGNVGDLYPAFCSIPEVTDVIFHGSVGNIDGQNFMGCEKLKNLQFKGDVGAIGLEGDYDNYNFAMLAIETLDFYGNVGGIYSSDFSNCANLSRVTFHKSVGYISGFAFGNCKKLTHFTVAEGNNNLYLDPDTKIMYNADRSLMMMPSNWDYDGVIIIPETVTTLTECQFGSAYAYIGAYTLTINHSEDYSQISAASYGEQYFCRDRKTKLKGVIFHDKIENLPWGTFLNCVSIKNLDVKSLGEYLGDYCFNNCTALETLNLPDSFTEIGEYVFSNCKSLKSFVMPSEITYLPEKTFENCYALETIVLGESFEEASDYCFKNCKALKEIVCESFAYIGEGCFYGCSALEKVAVSSDVCDIYPFTFYECEALKDINIGENLETIGQAAFAYCLGLKNFVFGENLNKLGSYAFNYAGLESVSINSDVAFNPTSVFLNCKQLKEFNVIENNNYVKSIDGIAFDKEMTAILLYPALKEGNEYSIPASITEIGDSAFEYTKNLNKVNINNVTEIGNWAFNESNISEIDLSDIVSFGSYSFCSTKLTEIVISGNIMYLMNSAFANNTFDKVTICADAEEFDFTFVFYNTTIKEFNIEEGNKYFHFNGNYMMNTDNTIIYLYTGNEEKVIIPEGVEVIMANAFINNNAIKSVEFPASLKAIGDKAFYGNTNLCELKFNSVKAPALYGLKNTQYILYYANFVDYIENMEKDITVYHPEDETYNTSIWQLYFKTHKIISAENNNIEANSLNNEETIRISFNMINSNVYFDIKKYLK